MTRGAGRVRAGIHIGAHKTATTHLQQGLEAIAGHARDRGLAILVPPESRQPPCNLPVQLRQSGAGADAAGAAALAEWRQGAQQVLISDELIGGHIQRHRLLDDAGALYPKAGARIGRLISLLGCDSATLFLSIRRPDAFLLSAFGENLRAGDPVSLPEFLGALDIAALRWSELVARLGAIAGVGRIVVWRLEDFGALRGAVLARMVGPDLAARIPDRGMRRPGPSQQAYDEIRRALRDNPGHDRSALAWAMFKAFPKGPDWPGLDPLPARLKRACADAYDADCARIAAQKGVRFLRP